jgi:hypothetical protein
MKVSRLIENLTADIAAFGDHEVYFPCDCFDEGDGEFWIDGTGISAKQDGEARTLVVCGECHHQAIAEKYMFDGE